MKLQILSLFLTFFLCVGCTTIAFSQSTNFIDLSAIDSRQSTQIMELERRLSSQDKMLQRHQEILISQGGQINVILGVGIGFGAVLTILQALQLLEVRKKR